jgi:hypothetical protein
MVLNSLGVFFGDSEQLNKPYEGNEKGSWEHVGIERINKELLTRLGGSWHDVPQLPQGWEEDSVFDDLKADARALIGHDFNDASVWGWKDPPTCFTMPFWRLLLPPMHYVVCFRNPLDVARSLERRDGFCLEKGFHLWLLHTKFALSNTAGERRVLVFSEQWIERWEEQLQLLCRFLSGNGQMSLPDARRSVEAVIDESLWHYQSATTSISKSLQIYERLLQHQASNQNGLDQMLQEVIDLIRPEAQRNEATRKTLELGKWTHQLRKTTDELDRLIAPHESLILVDQAELGYTSRRTLPFLETNGQYGGPPADDIAAIREFERLRSTGASFIVFAWPAFWWLGHYPGLTHHLRSNFRCIVQNDRVAVFDLR